MIRFRLTLPSVPTILNPRLVTRIRERFAQEAGQIIINAIRAHLGEDSTYSLTPDYAKRKPQLKKYQRFPGRSADQPLILSGEMFNSLTWAATADGLTVQVEDGKAVAADGFDYAEWFEELVSYLELGLADVEDDLPELLATIIEQEMLL